MIKHEKRRYLALQVSSDQALENFTVFNAVKDSVLRLFGEYGASKANLKQVKFFPEKNLVIRCSHLMLEQVRAAVTTIVEINKIPVAVNVSAVSGTLKSLSKKV
ncbi:MAG: Rpp14/Pop5 family protein [Candidatus Bathyarchaeota archaeon]|nr:Rpp14/Pop5 family protein [Candidatus Bathyarchaeota archaeon]